MHNEKRVEREAKDVSFLTLFLKRTKMPCSDNSVSIFELKQLISHFIF